MILRLYLTPAPVIAFEYLCETCGERRAAGERWSITRHLAPPGTDCGDCGAIQSVLQLLEDQPKKRGQHERR